MESSFESEIYGSKNTKINRVPTLKYLVSQSIDGFAPVHSSSGPTSTSNQFNSNNTASAKPNGNHGRSGAANNGGIVGGTTVVQANLPPISTADDKNTTEGSGDILNGSSKYLQQSELDLSQLLVTAYDKGAEWIQAGASLALNIFSEETDPAVPTHVQRKEPIIRQSSKKVQSRTETTEAPSCLGQKARHPNDPDPEQPVRPKRKEVTFQEQRSAQTSAQEKAETDDTAYYNGYCARVRGRGVMLDTIFVNGSGPSNKSLEIRIRLELPPPEPGVYGQLSREYCGRDDKTLHLRYTHGSVEGTVDVLCPPQIDPHKLLSVVRDNFLLVTSP